MVLSGTLTMYLGEPPEPVEVQRGGLTHVDARTPLQTVKNPRRRWPRDPDDLEDAQKRPLRDAMLELEGEPDGAALITRRASYDVLLDHA